MRDNGGQLNFEDVRAGALLNRFWCINRHARAIDHLLYDSYRGFCSGVTGGRSNVLRIGVVEIASAELPLNRLFSLGQPLPRPVLIHADS